MGLHVAIAVTCCCSKLDLLNIGVYGDVFRVKIMFNKKDTALVQFADPGQAQIGELTPRLLFGISVLYIRLSFYAATSYRTVLILLPRVLRLPLCRFSCLHHC